MLNPRTTLLSCLMVGLAIAFMAPDVFAEKLPVFRLEGPRVDPHKASQLFSKTLGAPPTVEETDQLVIRRSGKKFLEIDKRSGHIFLGDMEKLWNPRAKPAVPDRATVKNLADRFLMENGLAPTGDPRVRVSFSHFSATLAAPDAPGAQQKQLLDRQANYRVEIVVRGPAGDERTVPVYGGGGKLKVAVGDRGAVVGFQGGWREIGGVESEEEILPQAAAEAVLIQQLAGQPVTGVRSRLAYYAAPAFEAQTFLAPVWVVGGRIEVGQESVPLREVIVPATKFAPRQEPSPAASQARTSNLVAKAIDDDNLCECGTSWVTSNGLVGSPGNRQGFMDQCWDAGWTVNFDWGDQNAYESDWNAYDDSWVDAADLVFYTGHADQNGWVLNPPNDNFFHFTEVQAAGGDLYGNTDLEWLIVAACGPHQSTHFTTNTTNAFDRWRSIFGGLHVFLGYGSITFDNESEGRRFMELTRAGWNVVDAWFRTAWEVQPSENGYSAPDGPTVYVTAMYAHNGDHCARYEQLWGMGYTCDDVTGPYQKRTFMWSGT